MAVDYLFVSMVFTFILGFVFMLLSFESVDDEDSLIPSPIRNVAYNFFAAFIFYFLGQQFLMAYSSTTTFVLPFWMLSFGLGLVNFTLAFIWLFQVFAVVWRRRKAKEEGMEEE